MQAPEALTWESELHSCTLGGAVTPLNAMPKISAARADAEIGASAAAPTWPPSETTGDLERLRASLDTKLAELEAALANPDGCDSLERLVIELARIATREADAAATRAGVEAQLAAQAQVSRARVETDRAVQSAVAAAQAARSELDAARATLEKERAAAATLNRQVTELDAALNRERAAARAVQQAAEEAEQRVFVVETVKERELADLRDQLGLEHAAERARLEQTQEALRLEVAAARDAGGMQRDELEASRRRVEAAEQRVIESEREHREADVRADAAGREAAALADELRAARETGDRRRSDLEAAHRRIDATELRTTDSERERLAAEIRAEAARTEAAALAAELRAAREAGDEGIAAMDAMQVRLDAAHAGRAALTAELETACESSRAAFELRAQLEFADAERAGMERSLAGTKGGLDAALRERDDARAELHTARNAAHVAAAAAEVRYDDLRGSSAVRIRDLENALVEARAISAAPALVDYGGDEIEDDDLGAALWDTEPRASDINAPSAADAPSLIPPARRTDRHAVSDGVEVQVDDAPATLVDLSVNGAQILSLTALKPNRAVALLLPVGGRSVLCRGKIVWARLEASNDALRYRGGIFFTHVEQAAIKAFLAGSSPRAEGGQTLSAEADTACHIEPAPSAASAR